MTPDLVWEQRIVDLWAAFDECDPVDFLAQILAASLELPAGHPVGFFELASAHDSVGRADQAVPLYRQALAAGLPGSRRRRAVIQLASSLRSLGQVDECVDLLTAERAATSDDLDDAVTAFLALGLLDAGREREAAALALGALAPHLPRYQRSLAAYAQTFAEHP